MSGEKFEESPPWFEATPLYDIIPTLHRVGKERKAPQTDADFIVTYADDKGPLPPSLVDVKSSRPSPTKRNKRRWNWQIIAAVRRGFIFRLAFPKEGIEYPKSLKEWESVTPCPECGWFNESYRKCERCGKELIPFSIVDAHFEAKRLWDFLGRVRKGRF